MNENKQSTETENLGIDPERVIVEAQDVLRQYTQYDEVVNAVNRVSLRIYEGEFVALSLIHI